MAKRLELMEEWAAGGIGGDTLEKSALMNAAALATCQAFKAFHDLDYDQMMGLLYEEHEWIPPVGESSADGAV